MSKVVIGGKTYTSTSGNQVIAGNTDEELDKFFNGNGIDAMWTRHIKHINKQLEGQEYKAGRPCKAKPVEQQVEMGM